MDPFATPPLAFWSDEDRARAGVKPPPPRKGGTVGTIIGALVLLTVIVLSVTGHLPIACLLAIVAGTTRIK